MNIKLLTEYHLESVSLKGGCTGSFEATLVKKTHCWKSHVVAHLSMLSMVEVNYRLLRKGKERVLKL